VYHAGQDPSEFNSIQELSNSEQGVVGIFVVGV
jgi:hypothetical protein